MFNPVLGSRNWFRMLSVSPVYRVTNREPRLASGVVSRNTSMSYLKYPLRSNAVMHFFYAELLAARLSTMLR
jgi:hypothetical protein